MTTVREALQAIDRNCDGAVTHDGVGFNGVDTGFAKAILEKPYWTPKMEAAAHKLLKKYSKQLADKEINYEDIQFVEVPRISERFVNLSFNGTNFEIQNSFDEKDFVKSIKAHGRKWDPDKKVWNIKPTELFMSEIMLYKDKFTSISQEARDKLNELYKISKTPYVNPKAPPEPHKSVAGPSVATADLSAVKSYVKTPYFTHQRMAFEQSINNPNYGYFMEQGTGKTLPAIGLIGYRAEHNNVKRVLIVAPLSVLSEWERQISEHADYETEVTILAGETVANRKDYLTHISDSEKLEIILLNYDVVKKMEESISKWSPDMIICDESQKIKNGRAQQSKSIASLGKKTSYKLILTGTPITQGPLDIWSQYRFLDSSIFGNSFVKFRDRYAVMGGYMGKQVIATKTVPTVLGKPNRYYDEVLSEEFTRKMYSVACRVTKEEAIDLPEAVSSYRFAKLEPKAMKMYQKMEKDAILTLGEDSRVSAPIVLTQLLRLQQICGGFVRPDESEEYLQVSSAKLEVMREIFENNQDKMVIFAKFIPEIEAISKMATEMGISHHTLTGKTKNRGQVIKEFQNDSDIQLFIAQIQTGGVGITLTAAPTVVFFSTGYSLIDYEQAKARVHRIGQNQKVNYIHIMSEGTVDVDIIKELARKQDIATMSVDILKTRIFKEEAL